MAIRPGRLLTIGPSTHPGTRWLATIDNEQIVAEMYVNNEGGYEYSVRAGYMADGHLLVRQRTFRLNPQENLNNLGLLARAIKALEEDV